jgi:hypothetical protein
MNLDVSSKPSTLGLNTDHSSSERNLHHVSPVEIKLFPKAEAFRENRRQKTWKGVVLADIPVNTALEVLYALFNANT